MLIWFLQEGNKMSNITGAWFSILIIPSSRYYDTEKKD